jgi:hypothetical protein
MIAALVNYVINSSVLLSSVERSGALNIFLYSTVFGYSVFSYVAPIIAVIPFGTIYLDHQNTGFFKQEIARVSHKKYLFEKCISSFIVGGITFIASGFLLLLCSYIIDPTPSIRIYNSYHLSSFSELYSKSMLRYILLYIANSAVFGGLYSVLCMSISSVMRNKLIAIITPAIFYITSTVSIGSFFGIEYVLPFSTFIIPSAPAWSIFKDHFLICVLAGTLMYIGERKYKS